MKTAKLVKSSISSWPGISVKHGPSTLLQGYDTCELDSFADKVDERIAGFVDIYQHVDNLLDKAVA